MLGLKSNQWYRKNLWGWDIRLGMGARSNSELGFSQGRWIHSFIQHSFSLLLSPGKMSVSEVQCRRRSKGILFFGNENFFL